MAIDVPSLQQVSTKWARNAAAATRDYQEGVQRSTTDWADATAAAEQTYNLAVQEAIGRGAFASGVQRTGTQKWRRKTEEVGVPRYGPGVAAAVSDYSSGVQPYLDELRSLTLPPRGPKGSPANIARVTAVTEALRARKLQIQGL